MAESTIFSEQYDFIVVGGGTAGCCVAGRLAENPNVSVLIIEAGEGNTWDVRDITTPALGFTLPESRHDWAYQSTMVNRADYQRAEHNTRGKILGGSSCLNYFTWIQGSKGTYDGWTDYGGDDWSYDNCREYFAKPATYHDDHSYYSPDMAKTGRKGPIHIGPADLLPRLQPFRSAVSDAWLSHSGHGLTKDIYSGNVNGLAHVMCSIHNGTRSFSGYFVENKPNITVKSSARSKKIIVDNGMATGILIQDSEGKEIVFKAKKEIIVSSGAFGSPHLLLLSGIGPRDHLSAHQINCTVDSPQCGRHLLDHPVLPHVFRLKDGQGLDQAIRSQVGTQHTEALAEYARDRKGPLSSGLLELCGFPRIDDQLKARKEWRAEVESRGCDPFGPQGQPHFELDFIPMFAKPFLPHVATPSEGDYMTIITSLLRPISEGSVQLNSADPLDNPHINTNYFSDELDMVAMREGVRFVDNVVLHGNGMKDLILEEYPKALPRDSDEELRQAIMERVTTGYHPSGTCRMGKTISEGVVSGQLKVHGVSNLRVIDASVFPIIPDCRIQSPTYMTAEKGADLIRHDYPDLFPANQSNVAERLGGLKI